MEFYNGKRRDCAIYQSLTVLLALLSIGMSTSTALNYTYILKKSITPSPQLGSTPHLPLYTPLPVPKLYAKYERLKSSSGFLVIDGCGRTLLAELRTSFLAFSGGAPFWDLSRITPQEKLQVLLHVHSRCADRASGGNSSNWC